MNDRWRSARKINAEANEKEDEREVLRQVKIHTTISTGAIAIETTIPITRVLNAIRRLNSKQLIHTIHDGRNKYQVILNPSPPEYIQEEIPF